ncbi:MAG TPA: hypothetical protein RMH99_23800 [Sandaracinaceae bacterium LLY-WYZ-13_1]|nr:hypothetical protein [Sandaracinaceae bacterium LLY-WYZ-13_1]
MLALSACTCEAEPAPSLAPASPDEPAARSSADPAWPPAVVADLPPATPATEVTVRPGALEVRNHALVATWPADALARARADGPAQTTDWPRVTMTLEDPSAEGRTIPGLRDALETARRAERASTGSGSGAGVYNLRVAEAVPFERVERVLYTASLAGYGAPRLLLRAGRAEHMMPWPRAPEASREGPSEAAIRAAFEALEAGADVPTGRNGPAAEGASDDGETTDEGSDEGEETAGEVPAPRTPRLILEPDRVRAWLGDALQAPRCRRDAEPGASLTLTGEAPADAVDRCLASLRERGEGDVLTVEVAPRLPFGRLAPVLQHAARRFEGVRVVSR